ncbi:MAG: TetR/AcrR family transcriptional regulator [Tissierellia bacterium]|nr:TetR/AcrR family transcriptional regulator [Tissierellia bacterium]
MVRISKPPQERRKEIVLMSRKLFDEKGFQNTAIDDITNSLNIAKGTFYYYFKSKDDVLDAVVDSMIEKDVASIQEIADSKEIKSTEKLRLIRKILSDRYREHYGFLEHSEIITNMEIRLRWLMGSFESKTPLITAIMEEGVERGEFKTDHPKEMAELALVSVLFLLDPTLFPTPKENYVKRLENFEEVLEKSLGLEKGELHFISGEL